MKTFLIDAGKQTALWLAAFAAALAIAAAWQLDGSEDHQADWAKAEAIQQQIADEEASARHVRAAQALCNEERGPNSEARFTLEGQVVCTTRRGFMKAQVQL